MEPINKYQISDGDEELKPTLVIYKVHHSEEDLVRKPGGMLASDSFTSLLRDSHDYRPLQNRTVRVGERLYCSSRTAVATDGSISSLSLPTEWVVVEVEKYLRASDRNDYFEVAIAYCKRQPLSLEEFKEAAYEGVVSQGAIL